MFQLALLMTQPLLLLHPAEGNTATKSCMASNNSDSILESGDSLWLLSILIERRGCLLVNASGVVVDKQVAVRFYSERFQN